MDAEVSDLSMPRVSWRAAYLLRLKRKRLLWRAFRARRQLTPVKLPKTYFRSDEVIAFVVLRNERTRLPYFLEHYRRLGVSQFCVVDNDSTDGSDSYLHEQEDVALWHASHGYRASRFGLDWITWLQRSYGHDRWCLTVDADELLTFDGSAEHGLPQLTAWLDQRGLRGFGAMMLDLYPKGSLADCTYTAGQNPCEVLNWFDPSPYRAVRQAPFGNLWLQGGARERVFFADRPERSPTLNKIPLVKWDKSYVYVNSTHSILPRALNELYDGPAGPKPRGVLLHTKFLPEIVAKSETEKSRQQHFHTPPDFDRYYEEIMAAPDMWHAGSCQLRDHQQLIDLGLMSTIQWGDDLPQTNSNNL
ncbi:glycosyltransferase family 2 protein [Epibacterium ulvae]|uniref:glycosyltransferase family 2 protein n=1 Tax=Epibacterium ulvae TaxID=1156985 RepID=UPI001BFC3EB5|nr:glycosyltransferase family 2 protein [Epibacterium ulvae]MBT8153539.1 glycosyltransferase family 2 protein [Epibacterium ulvae]